MRAARRRDGAWGALYVLEGARLGSQLLAKGNQKNPVLSSASLFLRGEGTKTAAGWRTFLALLPSSGDLDAAGGAGAAVVASMRWPRC